MGRINTIIKGTGSYIPENTIKNEHFLTANFLDNAGNKIDLPNEEIITKFHAITDIKERKYASDNMVASDLSYLAAKDAIDNAGIDKETIDCIIVGHNFGDIKADSYKVDILPSLASRVKEKLGIKNTRTIAYDILFGCPGWVQGMIQGHIYIKSGEAKRVLVIGTDTLSRIYDKTDRDSMLYADGAGATIIEGVESDTETGFLSHLTETHTEEHTYNLWMGDSFDPNDKDNLYLKMNGRKLYNYALSNVPQVVKDSIDKAGVKYTDIKKILIHQANAKMDDAILKRLFRLFGIKEIPKDIMPMTISELGNSSVATVPTLLDLISKGKMNGHSINSGDHIVLASVGAGMNINSIVYRVP